MASIAAFDTLTTSSVEHTVYSFHDVHIHCQSNHHALLAAMKTLLASFPMHEKPCGEVDYHLFCYEHTAQFPVPLPGRRTRTGAIRLLNDTQLKFYCDGVREYQSYDLPAPILTVIDASQRIALTQFAYSEHFEQTFLRRYVLLLALGRLIQPYGFVPCHAAAVTAPWDDRQGALIVGASGSGKTTLSLGCAINGGGLLGDDLVMLRSDTDTATVSAYSILPEISVRSTTLDLWPDLTFLKAYSADARDKRYCTIEQLRSGSTRRNAPIRAIVFPALTTTTRTTLTPLSKAQTLQRLIQQCIGKGSTMNQLFPLLSTLAEQAPGYHLDIAHRCCDGPKVLNSLFQKEPL